MEAKFDPFNDRLARDIRNALSSALVESFTSMTEVEEVAQTFLSDARLLPHHRAYIQERLQRYAKVQAAIMQHHLNGFVCPALAMWDEQLFFEVHECLEGEWYPAPAGERKKALQALICAAGTFVHIEQGNKKGSAKMAARAMAGLKEFGHALPELGPAAQDIIASLSVPGQASRILLRSYCCAED